jgi:hypothetical protein
MISNWQRGRRKFYSEDAYCAKPPKAQQEPKLSGLEPLAPLAFRVADELS